MHVCQRARQSAVPSSAVIYFNYLEEKAHALAEEKFSEDELDAVKYRNVVIIRQNSIPMSKEMFINVADRVAAEKQLMQYLDRGDKPFLLIFSSRSTVPQMTAPFLVKVSVSPSPKAFCSEWVPPSLSYLQ